MSDLENVKINAVSCSTCVHNQVCSYKEDFLDVCNAVLDANVHKHEGNGKIRTTNVTNYDFLDEIVVKCKHYYAAYYKRDNGFKTIVDSNDGITVTCPPNIDTHQTATDPRLWTGVYTIAHN